METTSTHNMNRGVGILVIIVALCTLILPGNDAFAQPNLNFKRITVKWPTIELYFSVGCNGNPAYNMDKQDFRIYERGFQDVEIKDFTLWCPDPTIRCAISVALVFDASGSMSGSGNAGAKMAGHAFVDLMDGALDEAAIIWFSSVVTVFQSMTTIKPFLHAAVDALPVAGATAVWDGCYAGIIELVNNGVNQCRAVVVLTDGGDNSSSRTPAEIISLANRNRIRVFTVGLGSNINDTELQMIALLTGGRYYQTPNAGQLAAIYSEITTIIFQGFQECVITYERDCADGGMRTVELILADFCGGTDSKTKTYRAPLDSTTFTDLYMEFGDVEGFGTTDVVVPLNLVTPLTNEVLYPFTLTMVYDTSCIQFGSVAAPPGSPLWGVPLQVIPVAEGLRISSKDPKVITGNGVLLEFTFHARDVDDTTCCDIWAENADFNGGCRILNISPGEICILPPPTEVTCTMEAPDSLIWQSAQSAYVPNPFPVTARFHNSGIGPALDARFTITSPGSDIQLVSPTNVKQGANPPDIQPGTIADATWQVLALPRSIGDSIHICITGEFDNHPPVSCCRIIYVPPVESEFECSVEVPNITVLQDSSGYDPMPFTVRASLKNIGTLESGRLKAEIFLPAGFTLTGNMIDRLIVREVVPSRLLPGDSTSVEWYLEHPVTAMLKKSAIRVAFYEDSNTVCGSADTVRLPPLSIPLYFTLNSSGALTLCQGDSVELSVPREYASYLWSNGRRGQRITVGQPGSYYCTVQTAQGQPGYSDTVNVVVHPLPYSTINVLGNLPLCDGDSVSLDAGAGFVSYEWNTGARTRSIIVTSAGSYHAEITDLNGCMGNTDTVDAIMYPSPPNPVITRSGDVLTTDVADSYRWIRNDQLLPGDTSRSLVVVELGSYQVRVTNSYGCSAVSFPYRVNVLDINNGSLPVSWHIAVFPDPARNAATLQVDIPTSEEAGVWLIDVLGRSTKVADVPRGSGMLSTSLDLTNVPRGSYHVVVYSSSGVHTRKCIRR